VVLVPIRVAREGALDNPAPRSARGTVATTRCAAAEAAATTISRGASIL